MRMLMKIFMLFFLMHITRWFYIGKVGILYKTGIKHQLIHSYHQNTTLTLKEYINSITNNTTNSLKVNKETKLMHMYLICMYIYNW
jgi:uncharacterized membrane protein SpoIIM required for sporulation